MTLQGKGFFIWKVRDCERGDVQAIASLAQSAGLSHVLIKIADANLPYNVDSRTQIDLALLLAQALRDRGIQVWGWHYVYGQDPAGEARIAIRRVQQLNLDGYVIDAEAEYKEMGKAAAARRFMRDLRQGLPNVPVALSSFRFPSLHPQLPWKEFLELCDYNMPQVYFEQAHNPDAQLRRCLREFQAMTPARPVIPTGPTYKWNGWRPTDSDISEFLRTSETLKFPALNFYSWEACRRDLPNLWDLVAQYPYGAPPPAPLKDITEQYIEALNSRLPAEVVSLYQPNAVHITSARTVQGTAALHAWYETFLNLQNTKSTFAITGCTGSGNNRHFTWSASAENDSTFEGKDTFGLLNGKVVFHYSSFSKKS
jgi:hypothetical protein